MIETTALFASGLIGQTTRTRCMGLNTGLSIGSVESKQRSKTTYNYNSNFDTRTPKIIIYGKPYKTND